MRTKSLLFTFLTLALLYAHAAEKKVLEGNETGDITLTQPTTVGNLTLQPGDYYIEDKESDGQHSIRFSLVKLTRRIQTSRAYTGWVTDRDLSKVGDVKCNAQPLDEKARNNTATLITGNGAQRLADVTLKGKKTLCVF